MLALPTNVSVPFEDEGSLKTHFLGPPSLLYSTLRNSVNNPLSPPPPTPTFLPPSSTLNQYMKSGIFRYVEKELAGALAALPLYGGMFIDPER